MSRPRNTSCQSRTLFIPLVQLVYSHIDIISVYVFILYPHHILLQQACIDDDLDMVEFLVEQGADINRGDNEGWTPLHATASCGFISIAKLV